MLAQERLDGLVVATPHVAHAGPAVAGLDAGCHVLVEKPMADSLDEAVRAVHTAFDLDAETAEAVVYGGTGR